MVGNIKMPSSVQARMVFDLGGMVFSDPSAFFVQHFCFLVVYAIITLLFLFWHFSHTARIYLYRAGLFFTSVILGGGFRFAYKLGSQFSFLVSGPYAFYRMLFPSRLIPPKCNPEISGDPANQDPRCFGPSTELGKEMEHLDMHNVLQKASNSMVNVLYEHMLSHPVTQKAVRDAVEISEAPLPEVVKTIIIKEKKSTLKDTPTRWEPQIPLGSGLGFVIARFKQQVIRQQVQSRL